MVRDPHRMIRRALVSCASVALCLVSRAAFAQGAWQNPTRSPASDASAPNNFTLGVPACRAEQWTFRVTLAQPPAGDLAVFVRASSDGTAPSTCNVTTGNGCTRLGSVTVMRDGMNLTFTIPANLLVPAAIDPCGVDAEGRTRVFVVENPDAMPPAVPSVIAGSPYVPFDLRAPRDPQSVTASPSDEGAVTISWAPKLATTDGGATVMDATNPSDATSDATVDADMDAGVTTDTGSGTDAGDADVADADAGDADVVDAPEASVVTMARYILLCEPQVGATCGDASAGALGSVDPYDADMLARYTAACGSGVTTSLPGTNSSATLQGLRSGAAWQFGVIAEDFGGNRSRVGVSNCVTVQSYSDFWEAYRQSGGTAQPGVCAARPGVKSSSGAWWWTVAGLFVAWRRARRYRGRLRDARVTAPGGPARCSRA